MHIQTFQWVIDANGDGSISLSDIIETLRWIYRIPGSLVVEALGNTPVVSDMLRIQASQETGYASLNGGLASILSLLFWAVLILWLLYTSSAPKPEPESKTSRRAPRLGRLAQNSHGRQLHANHDRHQMRQRQVQRHTF